MRLQSRAQTRRRRRIDTVIDNNQLHAIVRVWRVHDSRQASTVP
ncbi:MAG TPA: hypothetical protein VMU84_15540 [Thermoanaerobaculia bacterium]|nr:hypothetical protein [Thermoanaerobaculia bacterium]